METHNRRHLNQEIIANTWSKEKTKEHYRPSDGQTEFHISSPTSRSPQKNAIRRNNLIMEISVKWVTFQIIVIQAKWNCMVCTRVKEGGKPMCGAELASFVFFFFKQSLLVEWMRGTFTQVSSSDYIELEKENVTYRSGVRMRSRDSSQARSAAVALCS